MTYRQKVNLIRNSICPDTLENLFEMQNRVCDLCGHPIQDLVLAAIDHSTPISWFLRSGLSMDDVLRDANSPNNLRCAHITCNSAKCDLTREEWFTQGLNNRAPRLYTPSELTVQHRWFVNRQTRRSSAGGHTMGVRTRDSHTGMFSLSPAERLDACAKGGRRGGQTNATTAGYLSRIGKLGGQARAVLIKATDPDYYTRMRSHIDVEKRRVASQINGATQGRKNAESGHIQTLAHNRYHRTGVSKPETCELCRTQNAMDNLVLA